MKAIDKRISLAALGGFIVAAGLINIISNRSLYGWILSIVLWVIGILLVRKGRFF